jgi:hypothetical protein
MSALGEKLPSPGARGLFWQAAANLHCSKQRAYSITLSARSRSCQQLGLCWVWTHSGSPREAGQKCDNLKIAQVLGLKVPQSLLVHADDIIE